VTSSVRHLNATTTAAEPSPHKQWYERARDSLPGVAEILTAVVAAIALAGFVRGVYRRTLGRRRDSYARLRRLGTHAQLSFFSSVLGEPPALRRSLLSDVTVYDDNGTGQRETRQFIEAVYIDRDFYVHVYTDHDETVQAYSVTTRSKRFKPRFRSPGGWAAERRWLRRWARFRYRFVPHPTVTLGKTRFIELGRPDCAAAWLGAHNAHYFEAYYCGNPGYYQNFVYSINDAGVRAWEAPWSDATRDLKWGLPEMRREPGETLDQFLERAVVEAMEERPDTSDDEDEIAAEVSEPPEDLQAFRHRARVNTYTVIGLGLALDDYPGAEGRLDEYSITFGVNSARVRTLA
jgi:hypothetical protein